MTMSLQYVHSSSIRLSTHEVTSTYSVHSALLPIQALIISVTTPSYFQPPPVIQNDDAAASFSSPPNYLCSLPLAALLLAAAECLEFDYLVLVWEPRLLHLKGRAIYSDHWWPLRCPHSLGIFPCGYHSTVCWVPEDWMTSPLWSEKQSHPSFTEISYFQASSPTECFLEFSQ